MFFFVIFNIFVLKFFYTQHCCASRNSKLNPFNEKRQPWNNISCHPPVRQIILCLFEKANTSHIVCLNSQCQGPNARKLGYWSKDILAQFGNFHKPTLWNKSIILTPASGDVERHVQKHSSIRESSGVASQVHLDQSETFVRKFGDEYSKILISSPGTMEPPCPLPFHQRRPSSCWRLPRAASWSSSTWSPCRSRPGCSS